MRIYLKNLVKQLKYFSLSLDKTSVLIEKPWAMIDNEYELQKLIFRKNKELVMSKNGQVTLGRWDYLAEARSLLLYRDQDIILCNEGYIDHGVLILKKDGTDNQFFILANENIIPDLNIDRYLNNLRKEKLNLISIELTDGRKLEVARLGYDAKKLYTIEIGQAVYINGEELEDGLYDLKSDNISYLIKNSRIHHIYTNNEYLLKSGHTLTIVQKYSNSLSPGDKVYINGIPAPDGRYKLGIFKNIKVRDGEIV